MYVERKIRQVRFQEGSVHRALFIGRWGDGEDLAKGPRRERTGARLGRARGAGLRASRRGRPRPSRAAAGLQGPCCLLRGGNLAVVTSVSEAAASASRSAVSSCCHSLDRVPSMSDGRVRPFAWQAAAALRVSVRFIVLQFTLLDEGLGVQLVDFTDTVRGVRNEAIAERRRHLGPLDRLDGVGVDRGDWR